MILYVTIPLPDDWAVGPGTRMSVMEGTEVRDPASGVAGTVTDVRLNWRNGRAEIRAALDVTVPTGRAIRPRHTF